MSLKKISSQMDKLLSAIEAGNPSEDTIISCIYKEALTLESLIKKEEKKTSIKKK